MTKLPMAEGGSNGKGDLTDFEECLMFDFDLFLLAKIVSSISSDI